MAAKEILVKKYVVRLSDHEREQLAALIRKGSSPAHRLLKARILLKADVSEAGEGWSDNQIIDALATSASMVYRVRKQLVEDRGCVEPKATRHACGSQNFRWREGSQADCLGLFQTSQGPRTLDIAVVGKQGRGAEHRRSLVFVIEPRWPPLFHLDRSARFGNQLLRGLVQAYQRNIGIG